MDKALATVDATAAMVHRTHDHMGANETTVLFIVPQQEQDKHPEDV